jgi:hypothetical protein
MVSGHTYDRFKLPRMRERLVKLETTSPQPLMDATAAKRYIKVESRLGTGMPLTFSYSVVWDGFYGQSILFWINFQNSLYYLG